MRTDAVITIVGAHDARTAASRPTVPVPDRSCRARILVRGSDEKMSDEKMKASDVEAAGRPTLTRSGAAAGHPVTEPARERPPWAAAVGS